MYRGEIRVSVVLKCVLYRGLAVNNRERTPLEPYIAREEVPEEFLQKWNDKNIQSLPTRFKYRRNLSMELMVTTENFV